ncbi:MAG: hypothetical protein EOO01_01590 [Chitinophagaceae bacterium]|nr:MAG: hypothetical protein EOO01_01590 [Chitinophagaceae bacterium]
MTNCATIIRLINSLSSSEKRHFRLTTQKQAGIKGYLTLYEIIEKSHPGETDVKKVTAAFSQKQPAASIEATSKYLIKIITDCLIESKAEKDNEFNLYRRFLRVKILQERSLPVAANKELKKLRDRSIALQHHLMQYMTFRLELNQLSDQRFPGITDNYLVETQMKAKEILRMVHNIEGHYSLYELLKYRLIHLGKVVSDADKRKLNDLLLSEISLVTGKVKNSFESRKLHLLFQAFYFTDIADHRSALQSFNELNRLFEQNPDLHDHPPTDYFSALDGILDVLRMVKKYEQVPFYIDKLQKINTSSSPEYFRYLVQKTVAIYELSVLTGTGDFAGAVDYIEKIDPQVLTAYHLVNIEKQTELYFYCALAHFGKKQYKKAHKYLNAAMADNKQNEQEAVNKAARLLNIIIYYELKDFDYLQYQIRSYTRHLKQQGGLTKSEKLVLKTIQLKPSSNSSPRNKLLVEKMKDAIDSIRNDKYEDQLIKYFDFVNWSVSKFK